MTRPRCERPPRTCDGCGVQFRRRPRPSRKTFCTATCYREYQAAHRKSGGAGTEDDGGGTAVTPPADGDCQCPYCGQAIHETAVGQVPYKPDIILPPGTWGRCKVCAAGHPRGAWVPVDHHDLTRLKGPTAL